MAAHIASFSVVVTKAPACAADFIRALADAIYEASFRRVLREIVRTI